MTLSVSRGLPQVSMGQAGPIAASAGRAVIVIAESPATRATTTARMGMSLRFMHLSLSAMTMALNVMNPRSVWVGRAPPTGSAVDEPSPGGFEVASYRLPPGGFEGRHIARRPDHKWTVYRGGGHEGRDATVHHTSAQTGKCTCPCSDQSQRQLIVSAADPPGHRSNSS